MYSNQMPNDCHNYITIVCEYEEELSNLIDNELTRKPDENYMYNADLNIITRGKKGIVFETTTFWKPDFDWFDHLLTIYPNCWIKNEWSEEGGTAGVWIGCVKNSEISVQSMSWDDLSIEAKYHLFVEGDI
jgi:hypothetical protein